MLTEPVRGVVEAGIAVTLAIAEAGKFSLAFVVSWDMGNSIGLDEICAEDVLGELAVVPLAIVLKGAESCSSAF